MGTPQPRKQRTTTSDHIDPSSPAPIIVDKFGGLTRFCEATGFNTSTVHGWMKSGFVPARIHTASGLSYQAYILAKAAENKIRLKPEDFIEQIAA